MDQSPQDRSPAARTPTPHNIDSFFLGSESSIDSFFLEPEAFKQFNPLKTPRQSSQTSTKTPMSKPITPQSIPPPSEPTYQELCNIIKLQRKTNLKNCFNKWKEQYEKQQEKKWDVLGDNDKWDLVETSQELIEEQRANSSRQKQSRNRPLNHALQTLQWFMKK